MVRQRVANPSFRNGCISSILILSAKCVGVTRMVRERIANPLYAGSTPATYSIIRKYQLLKYNKVVDKRCGCVILLSSVEKSTKRSLKICCSYLHRSSIGQDAALSRRKDQFDSGTVYHTKIHQVTNPVGTQERITCGRTGSRQQYMKQSDCAG